MFRATHRPSSGAQKTVIAASGFTYVIGCRPLRWLSHCSSRQPITYVKPEAAITVFELLMTGGVSSETCWTIKKQWNNKFYYMVASCWFFLWEIRWIICIKGVVQFWWSLVYKTFAHNTVEHLWLQITVQYFNPLKPKLNPICCFLALLGAHHFLYVSRIRVKLLTHRLLMSYIYGAPILDVSRSHTTHHSR